MLHVAAGEQHLIYLATAMLGAVEETRDPGKEFDQPAAQQHDAEHERALDGGDLCTVESKLVLQGDDHVVDANLLIFMSTLLPLDHNGCRTCRPAAV